MALPESSSRPGSNAPGDKPALRSLAEARGILIGAAVAARPLSQEPQYAETLGREFSVLTPENATKFNAVHPARERYDFTQPDTIVAFAQAHGMKVRGHTLVWHEALPEWIREGKYTREELRAILEDHIKTVVGHFRGKVFAWDVVNEAVNDDGLLRDTIWRRGMGDDYLELAFRWAHAADPEALLFYNDYGSEDLGKKSDAVYALVKGLRESGVPIHGVGLQMHIGSSPPDPAQVSANVKRLGALGLEVHITEMDVQIQGMTGAMEEKLAAQAGIYGDILSACLPDSNFKAFVMWGFTDSHSWIPWFTKHPDAPLIFDESYRPKPAYSAIKAALAGR